MPEPTTVTIAGRTFEADTIPIEDDNGAERTANWINTGTWLQDTITARAEQLINEKREERLSANLPVRSTIDAAMRLQRDLDSHWRVDKVIVNPTAVTSHVDNVASLAHAVEDILAKLPELAGYAVLP